MYIIYNICLYISLIYLMLIMYIYIYIKREHVVKWSKVGWLVLVRKHERMQRCDESLNQSCCWSVFNHIIWVIKQRKKRHHFLMNPELVKLDIRNISNPACGEESSFPLWFSERFDWHLQAMAAALAGDTCRGRGAWLAVAGAGGRRV